MKALTVALLVGAMMALTAATDASINGTMSTSEGLNSTTRSSCPGGWTGYGPRCFLFVPRVRTWAQAEKNCLSMGGNLASVKSANEYHVIQRMIASQSNGYPATWIGGSDSQEEGSWFWSDGTLFTFQYWCSGEPNNDRGQHCIQINYGAEKCWDDLWCNQYRPSVCAKRFL